MKLIKTYKTVLLALSLVTVSGCLDDESDWNVGNSGTFINLTIPDAKEVSVGTRAISLENTIQNVWAFVFTSDGNLRKNEKCSAEKITNNGQPNPVLQLMSLKPEAGEKLYLFCNVDFSQSMDKISDIETLKKVLVSSGNSQNDFPMFGGTEVTGSSVNVLLTRSYSKVSMNLTNELTLRAWSVGNIPSRGFVADVNGYPSNTTFEEDIAAVNVGNSIYFNARFDNSSAVLNKKTYILVNLEEEDKPLGWYRLDFFDNDSYIDILRNYHYTFDIKSVKSQGYLTKEEAIDNPGSNIEYSIEIGDKDWGQTFSSNGQYILKTSQNEIILGLPQSDVVSNLLDIEAYLLGGDYHIKTYSAEIINGKGKIELEGASANGILDLSPGAEITSSSNTFRTIQAKIKGYPDSDCFLQVRLGNIVQKIPFRIAALANSYLVDFSSVNPINFTIPLEQANVDGVERISKERDKDAIDALILWADQPIINNLSVKYDGDFSLVVTSNKLFIGNVIVAATVNGTIKWSWHLWALPGNELQKHKTLSGMYDLADNQTLNWNTNVWMNRNLGALNTNFGNLDARGLLYQWGRKDPFPASYDWYSQNEQPIFAADGTQTQISYENTPDTGVNLENSICNPMTFFTSPEDNLTSTIQTFDWYTTNPDLINNSLWLKDGMKTPYDPCPLGWRVPKSKTKEGPWIGLYTNSQTIQGNYGFKWAESMIGYYPTCTTLAGYLSDVNNGQKYRRNKDNVSEVEYPYTLLWWADAVERIFVALNVDGWGGGVTYMYISPGETKMSIIPATVRPKITGASIRCVREE